MNRPAGEVLPFEQVWELSQRWYTDRLQPDFKGRPVSEAHDIFASLGLTSSFWRFDAPR